MLDFEWHTQVNHMFHLAFVYKWDKCQNWIKGLQERHCFALFCLFWPGAREVMHHSFFLLPKCISFYVSDFPLLPEMAISFSPFTLEFWESFFLLPADIRYESMINTMLKDLFELLVVCVAKPTETISRVGCSCIRWGKGPLALYRGGVLS